MTRVQFHLSWREYYEAERFLHRKLGLFSIPLFRQWRLKRRWARKDILRTEHQVTYSAEGIHYLLAEIESNLDWKYFQYWAENQNGFLLISAEEVFNLIPKRAFANPNQIVEFRKLLSSKLRPQ
jgi:hypothetical protein